MKYFPQSDEEVESMLEEIGVKTPDELFRGIPDALRTSTDGLALPGSMSEGRLLKIMAGIGKKNSTMADNASFLGGGVYSHFIPSVVDYLSSRGEFLTPYTPYQPEVSQGTLQYLFEFQSLISLLTGMDVANASLYDGATSLAEAVLMAKRITKKNIFLISSWVHPHYLEIVKAYTKNLDIELVLVGDHERGNLPEEELRRLLLKYKGEVGALVVQSPNFAGIVEDLAGLKKIISQEGNILLISCLTEAMSLGLIRGPGHFGVDIFAGEGQSFGIYPQAGGPHIGLLAAQKEYLRNFPGRLVGQTCEVAGKGHDKAPGKGDQDVVSKLKSGYVLTLSTREQHIRREKATSNICTNQGLMALRVCIYLSLYGKKGLYDISKLNHQKASSFRARIGSLPGWKTLFEESPVYNEFIVECPGSSEEFSKFAAREKLFPGIPLSRFYPEKERLLLVTTTEENLKEEMDLWLKVATDFNTKQGKS